ncbi:MAG: prolipoprotein diacylglyceryl transferase [Ignavibacteriae bacterium]|nr:prolipoprotein diacylglyceryl transferase [Ignavibacteriota bacterium]
MRSRIVDYLNQLTGTSIFHWVVPDPSLLYPVVVIICAFVYVKRCTASGLDRRRAIYSAVAASVGAAIGSRLFFAAQHAESYILRPLDLLAPGGTISWGAYLGVVLGLLTYTRIRNESSFRYLDVLGSCLALGPFLGRWICFLNGDDYGKITDVPWGIQYPAGSIPFAAHVNDGLVGYNSAYSATVHPNQLYLSLNGLVLYILMIRVWKKYRFHEGVTFGFYCLLYGISRFMLEFFRDEPSSALIPQLNSSQLFSLAAAGAGALFLIHHYRTRSYVAITGEGTNTMRGETP